jgi:guanylate kinase
VHKGERIDGRDYFFPDEFTPETGLELQSMAEWFDYEPTGWRERFVRGIVDTW